jgi:hypothetical protein
LLGYKRNGMIQVSRLEHQNAAELLPGSGVAALPFFQYKVNAISGV